MTKIDLLDEVLDLQNHNLLCYSTNYLMDEPKKGYEAEFNKTLEKIRLLGEIKADYK